MSEHNTTEEELHLAKKLRERIKAQQEKLKQESEASNNIVHKTEPKGTNSNN